MEFVESPSRQQLAYTESEGKSVILDSCTVRSDNRYDITKLKEEECVYEVGKDIQPGKYEISVKEGEVGYHPRNSYYGNEIVWSSDSIGATLYEGDQIIVDSSEVIDLEAIKEYDKDMISLYNVGYNYPAGEHNIKEDEMIIKYGDVGYYYAIEGFKVSKKKRFTW